MGMARRENALVGEFQASGTFFKDCAFGLATTLARMRSVSRCRQNAPTLTLADSAGRRVILSFSSGGDNLFLRPEGRRRDPVHFRMSPRQTLAASTLHSSDRLSWRVCVVSPDCF